MIDQSEDAIAQRRYEQARPRKEAPIDPKLLDGYVGYYQLAAGPIFSITRDGGRLFAQLTGQQASEIFPESDREFFSKVVMAQITFVTDGQGRASELVLHQNGFDQAAKRIDEADAKSAADNLARRIKEKIPTPGSEAALRGAIAAEQRGQPNYDQMGEALALAARQQLPMIRKDFESLGALQSVTFKGVGRGGWDVYDAQFAGGATEWRINLAPDGKIDGLIYRHLP
ncbi:DUF3471 domain-containing protein [Methylocapsa polymorpha]|uniref:DUF3471 domain-containing protein n=1 Tax=Methylocapsa polymorpha TaxID=3080828 RepID=A0ABZ0HWS6_9HYPH|nr:DUF3471 domain-containing protein [Methylocapsa sp. RX1]